MAEREGFEPSVQLSPYTRLAGERLQPARPSLRKNFSKIFYIKLRRNFIGGGSRIRTHGGVTLNGFQDRRFRPLSHPSTFIWNYNISIPVGDGQYLCPHRALIFINNPAPCSDFVCIMCWQARFFMVFEIVKNIQTICCDLLERELKWSKNIPLLKMIKTNN